MISSSFSIARLSVCLLIGYEVPKVHENRGGGAPNPVAPMQEFVGTKTRAEPIAVGGPDRGRLAEKVERHLERARNLGGIRTRHERSASDVAGPGPGEEARSRE